MGNNSSLTRVLISIKSKFLPSQSTSLIKTIDKPLIPRQLILYNRVTALVPIMPPNRGRAAKTAAANSIAGKSKQEKNEESDVEGDEEMAIDVKKKPVKGKKKENGVDEKPKARGRKKPELAEEIPDEAPKTSAKSKKKSKDEGQDEPEVRKSGRAKKKETPKDELPEEEPPKKIPKGKKKAELVENGEAAEEPSKPAKGRKKAEPLAVENGDEAEEPTKPTKGRKKAEEKPEKSAKRGKKGKPEEEANENGVEEDKDEKEEKAPKRGRKPPKESQNSDEEDEEEKPVAKRGRKLKEPKATKSEDSTPEEKPKAKGKGKRVNEEEAESATKKPKPEEKKPANKVVTNLDEIDFSCDKANAKGDKYNYKICCWNVAGMRAIQNKQGIDYILKEDADVVVLQETKCDTDKIPKVWELPGYKRFYVDSSSKSGYAGVALYSKKEPITYKYGLEKKFDHEGRLITLEYEGFYVLNVYVPNTGRGLVNMEKRLEWNEAFKKYLKELDSKKPVILCGDMNVAHQEIDLANPKTNTKNAGFTKEERDGMTDFLATGFVDTFRELYPEKTGAYTFWSNMRDSRSKNVGWRLDYFIVSERIKDNVCDHVMRSNVYGSDHCPIVLYINL